MSQWHERINMMVLNPPLLLQNNQEVSHIFRTYITENTHLHVVILLTIITRLAVCETRREKKKDRRVSYSISSLLADFTIFHHLPHFHFAPVHPGDGSCTLEGQKFEDTRWWHLFSNIPFQNLGHKYIWTWSLFEPIIVSHSSGKACYWISERGRGDFCSISHMLGEKAWGAVAISIHCKGVEYRGQGSVQDTEVLPFQPWSITSSRSSLCAKVHCDAGTGFGLLSYSEGKL